MTPDRDKSNTVAHTPGPWVLQGGQIYAVPHEPLDATTDDEPLCVADRDMDQRIDFDTVGEANGRLMAAAPDLLAGARNMEAALTGIQELLAEWIVPDSGISDHEVLNRILSITDHRDVLAQQDAARAAIQRAGGEQ